MPSATSVPHDRRRALRRTLGVFLTILLTALLSVVANPVAHAWNDDYPAKWRNAPMDSVIDDWRMYNRECTSFTAWRLHSRNGYDIPFHANAGDWGYRARDLGIRVDNTPAVGSVAWSSGHVAWVESVGNGTVTIEEYNYGYNGTYNERTVATGTFQYIHFKDIGGTPTPPPVPPAPGSLSALVHGSRVNLQWGASPGATDYQVSRNGVPIGTVTGTRLLDVQVSPQQSYGYSVVARNAAGSSAPTTRYVQTTVDSADYAYLPTKDGPAECGRAGDQNSQFLVCNVLKPSGWVSRYSAANDWGYANDRSWIANSDGSVSYCRRVGIGDQILCDRFDGTTWTSSMSPHYDLGYTENRAYLPTKDGPAVCGRAGDQNSQFLVCNVLKPTGWVSAYSPPNDWGYSTDRSWIANSDGSVSYCRRVGSGDQVLCDRFDGTTWTSSMSPHYDLGYHENRAYLRTKDGPAVCGRAGDQNSQFLVCNVLKPTGWVSAYSPPNDWGYANDRSWISNSDGSVSYCRRVGIGDQALCDRFDGTTWTSSMSPHYDLGYHENRSFLRTKDGPAVCGRAGDQNSQFLVCNVLKPTGWVTAYSPPNDWGYSTDRSWISNSDGSVSYCRRVGIGDQALCDRFDGTTWTSSMSPHYDLGYPDTFA